MAKIAFDLDRALARRARDGASGGTATRWLARGDGWRVADVLCTSGPDDRPFEERHDGVAVALVVAGSFQYRTGSERVMLTPGALMLGNARAAFECGHEHGAGDRCVSFQYDAEFFGDMLDRTPVAARFGSARIPALRELSGLVARTCAALLGSRRWSWEELSVEMAARAGRLAGVVPARRSATQPAAALARVTRVVRRIEADPAAPHTLRDLAAEARLSRWHFLRLFEQVSGLTPHRYLRRARLREAATRWLAPDDPGRVLDVAYDSGFGDVSNFNHAFRAEFGVSPRDF